ncbi:MAG TPA: clan AA aspartic protease [Pyrinomonadaceae bacterium]|nr:clan AA aspartic protease [Pyrinomonadaceae bacterium]
MLIPVPKKERPKYESGVNEMGLVYAEIDLISVDDMVLHRRGFLDKDKIKQVRVNALVDSGAYMLSINETVRAQLDLPFIEKQFGTLADETLIEVDVVGPVEIRFENRRTTVDAIVLPGDAEVLLGSIPMEDMDVLIDPKQQKLVVNPKHPYVATKHLK